VVRWTELDIRGASTARETPVQSEGEPAWAAPGFAEQALAFHRSADGIVAAARARDAPRVLSELGATLATCTSRHETWKQLVVDEATWQRLANSREPSH
jgi:hypothetical protein